MSTGQKDPGWIPGSRTDFLSDMNGFRIYEFRYSLFLFYHVLSLEEAPTSDKRAIEARQEAFFTIVYVQIELITFKYQSTIHGDILLLLLLLIINRIYL